MRKRLILVVFLFCMVFYQAAAAESTKNKQYRVPRVDSKIKADGVLDEDIWQKALVLELNYEVQPGENIKPPVRTEVLLANNKTHLFVAFRAFDPEPSKIRARISDRDDTNNQDWVGVILDTFNDERRSYDFLCNPLGVQTDFIEVSGGDGGTWDAIWDSGGRINEQGYFVEMSIPFSSLRFQRIEGDQVWGFDAVRSYHRTVRHHIGTFPRDRNNNCYLCQSIKLKGFNGARPGKNIELDPTISAHVTQERENGTEGPFIKDEKFDPGITARWGFTPNLTLSGTVNPDFSQVEADALQLDINEPFALFYSEKRPFFTEGADFFNTRLNAVYTRTMRDPSWGIKLTGKEGANTIGAYMVRDTLTNLIFPGSQSSGSTSLAMDSTSSVLRYRRDFGNKYTVGALFTNRQGGDYYNRVFGFDGDFRFTRKDRIRMQVLGSSTRYPDDAAVEFGQPLDTFNDKALDVIYIHDSRNLDFHVGYKDIGGDFRADLGFIPRVGIRNLYASADYTWFAEPGKWWTRFSVVGEYRQMTDKDGHLLNREGEVTFQYEGPLDTHSLIHLSRTREVYNGISFDMGRWYFHHCMNPSGSMHVSLNITGGDRIDYANTRLGKRINIRPGMMYYIGMRWRLNLSHTYERMWVDSERLYTANQGEMRLAYQFSKRIFLRAILQYVDYRYNVGMYINEIDPVYRHLFTQLLFSYKINPQTVLFLGYSDNYEGYDRHRLPQVNRTVFLKIGYALVM
ncbi:MAG: carbohydrate binding family 9 domain-containing protein [bacterium]|nr:carbohydrate binding family 9 domain-containing protein [bacterium]